MERKQRQSSKVSEWVTNRDSRRVNPPFHWAPLQFSRLWYQVFDITMFNSKEQPGKTYPFSLGEKDTLLYFWYNVLNSWREKKKSEQLWQSQGAGAKVEVLNSKVEVSKFNISELLTEKASRLKSGSGGFKNTANAAPSPSLKGYS